MEYPEHGWKEPEKAEFNASVCDSLDPCHGDFRLFVSSRRWTHCSSEGATEAAVHQELPPAAKTEEVQLWCKALFILGSASRFFHLNIDSINVRFQRVQSKVLQCCLPLQTLDLISVSLSLGLQNLILLSPIISPSHNPVVLVVTRCHPFQTLTCVSFDCAHRMRGDLGLTQKTLWGHYRNALLKVLTMLKLLQIMFFCKNVRKNKLHF